MQYKAISHLCWTSVASTINMQLKENILGLSLSLRVVIYLFDLPAVESVDPLGGGLVTGHLITQLRGQRRLARGTSSIINECRAQNQSGLSQNEE